MNAPRRVAILGAGTMGSRIAAHFANARVPALLLDLPGAAAKGLDGAAKGKPAAFFTESGRALVETGDFEKDLGRIAECDWIVEAIVENLDIKRQLWARVLELAHPQAVLSTNTSGIPLARIAEGWPEAARRRFLGTHFFNPPRYLHLLEVIPGPETDPALLAAIADFGDRRLGKGVVICKDTPNFIANRIGSFFGATVAKIMQEDGYTIEEVDLITGSLIGLPNSASFRLLDLVGVDVWAFVGDNLHAAVPHDPWRDRFQSPPFLRQMVEKGWLGDKTGQGFYRKTGPAKEIHAIDWRTLEYHPAEKPRLPEAEAAKAVEDLGERLRMLVSGTGRVGTFLWKLFSDSFLYCAERIPEIADRPIDIDRAMRWGYAHKLGPFELWDTLGFDTVCDRLEKEGRVLPENVAAMRQAGVKSWYQPDDAVRRLTGCISLASQKHRGGLVRQNAGASLIDLGDGVLCLEFHSKMNSLGADTIQMIHAGLDETVRNFEAMVIANEGENFSVGANLMLVLMAAQDQEWDELNGAIHHFQQAMMAIKYAAKPVVAAPFGRALGGGCEITLHSRGVQAAAELYMGLVEVGVGLIPGAGGCKELVARLKDPRKAFELIGYAKVSASAEDAKGLGLLDKAAAVSMNQDRLIADAKGLALSLVRGYAPGAPRQDIQVAGDAGMALLKMGAWMARQGNYISDHDVLIADKLANVLCGGRLTGQQQVSEQYLLDLEREAFLSLCGHPKTQERIAHMLKTGKPLRN
jgi:3-hydroxyacyl-CoA dehydrogenase